MRRTLVLVAALALLAGCRSDGGIGRSDSANNLKWTAGRMWDRTERDWAATKDNVASIGPAIGQSFTDAWREINYTMDLYLENQHSKAGYTRYERAER
jgi:outer membrane biogenesis lipoprotein LolB